MSALAAALLVDDLYRQAVEDPGSIDDATLVEWMEEAIAAVGHDRQAIRPLRAAARFARRLAAHFASGGGSIPDWRNGIDEALGSRGWEPQLDLVRLALDREPSGEAFAAVRDRHRAVHFTEWMEGISFEEWQARR